MQRAPLMVTVRNPRGRFLLDTAVARGTVEVLRRGALPSTGDRAAITKKTVEGDSMVRTLTDPSYAPGDRGAPPFVASILARVVGMALPTGLEFARYSIDYHYLRNALYVKRRMGPARAARHVPKHAAALMGRYASTAAALDAAADAADARPPPRDL